MHTFTPGEITVLRDRKTGRVLATIYDVSRRCSVRIDPPADVVVVRLPATKTPAKKPENNSRNSA